MKPRLAIAVLALAAASGPFAPAAEPSAPPRAPIPVDYRKLPNGLRVVLSTDHSAPIICVAVYYNVGFRLEPQGRTGFAHLFEHLMFEGSETLAKSEFARLVEENGGMMNGSTRYDFTNYFEVAPAHALDLPPLG